MQKSNNVSMNAVEIDLDALEKKALEATPGPWFSAGGYLSARDPDKSSFQRSIYHLDELGRNQDGIGVIQAIPFDKHHDAEFISAFNPEVAQELIRRLREAEKDAARLEQLIKDMNLIAEPIMRDHAGNTRLAQFYAAIVAAKAKETDHG